MTHEVTTYQTKRTLADALKSAMRQKNFSRISVSELVSTCKINRKTFYYHFQDMFALLKWMMSEETFSVVKQYDLLNDYEEAIRFAINYIDDNDYIISCACDSIGREEAKRFFYNDFFSLVSSLIDAVLSEKSVQVESELKSYVAKYHTEAFMDMLIDYAQHIHDRDKEQTIRYLTLIVRNAIVSVENLQ